ncbi:MAG: LysR family transcriptional regulator [Gracilibacteraceae bacterium]|jgi:DNA-binding transcriptional LysR family regulator|nr:LysR family transcriptional regulator [Gracilibacteraceae bacterium]
MEIESIRTFYQVAQYKSFQKASESLMLTQSGVSRRIQSLENELGVTLFHRTSQSVSLTKYGNAFLHYAKRIIQVYSDGVEALKKTPQESISIAIPF